MPKRDLSKITVKDLEREVIKHNRLYFVENSPEISDYEFDRLVEELRTRKPDSSVLLELTSDIRRTFKKVHHDVRMLSMDKCYDELALMDWSFKFEGDIISTPKIDGLALSLHYDGDGKLHLAATRGDGIDGEDVTENAKYVDAIPKSVDAQDIEVRGEAYMPISSFKKFSDKFANPRNLAAGGLKQKFASKTGEYHLSFFAYDLIGRNFKTECEKYEYLSSLGFKIVDWRLVGRDDMQSAFEYFLSKRDSFDFELDGVVFKANNVCEHVRLGSTAHHPRYAIAYKFQGESGITTIENVEWSVARTGVITPVAIVSPVELSGAMVRRASLHNIGIMSKLDISIGAKVVMMRRGGVIPNVESVVENGDVPVLIPDKCPSCGGDVERRDDFLYCVNPDRCVMSKVAELSHFVKAIGLDGFGDKLLYRLYENGLVSDAADIYDLTKNDLLNIERMGDVLAGKLIRNVKSSKNIPLSTFLRALGIRELGKHVADILAELGSLDYLMSIREEDLSPIKTIGPVIAHNVVIGLKSKNVLINRLLKHIKILESRMVPTFTWRYAKKSFLFTGKLVSMGRKEASRMVEERGGVVALSVEKSLNYLVIGDRGGAGAKLAKAEKINASGGSISIISESEFISLCNE